MERAFGKLAGAAAAALMMARLGRLMEVGPTLPRWPLILLASAILGAVAWWLLNQLITSRRLLLAVFAVAGLFLFLRISVPQGLTAGIIPSPATFPVLAAEVDDAIRLIRFGVAPIAPTPGVTAMLAILMWAIGALYASGATSGRSALMTLPSLAAYVQFAIFDRPQTEPRWMMASTAVLVLAVSAVAMERGPDTGQARDSLGRSIPRRSSALVLLTAGLVGVTAITAASNAADAVPPEGNIAWRAAGQAYGGSSGAGVAFNRLVDLRQSIISRSNEVVFRATLSDSAASTRSIYWRVESLDHFDGVAWRPSDTSLSRYVPGRSVSSPADRYQGTTVDVVQRVQIDALRGVLVPTAGVTTEVHGVDVEGGIQPTAFQVTPDASLFYQQGTRAGDTYQLQTVYPLQEADLGAMATGPDGELSPIFAGGAEAGLFDHPPTATNPDMAGLAEPSDLDTFTALPDTLPPGIAETAARVTRGASTDFERAWMLQHWFRDGGEFTYSTDVTTGHSALALDEWLADPESLNYRTGYCEQFAASMAVLGRALGIPSRVVWGFTPGSVDTLDGIEVVEVRDTNAHAWVEMWMDGFGWVTFDPTPRADVLPPSMTEALDPTEFVPETQAFDPSAALPPMLDDLGALGLPFDVEGETAAETSRWWLVPILLLALMGASVPTAKAIRRRRRLRLIRHGDITAAWDELMDRLTDLGHQVVPWKTPIEVANGVDGALLPLALHYSAAVYGGRSGDGGESDLVDVERWLVAHFDGVERARALVNPRSLLTGRS